MSDFLYLYLLIFIHISDFTKVIRLSKIYLILKKMKYKNYCLCSILYVAVACSCSAHQPGPKKDPSSIKTDQTMKNPKQRLPNQGAFRNGQAMWDWLGGAGDIWWDGSNPIYSTDPAENVTRFVNGIGSDAMKAPRPKKVKLYMQGFIPRLPNYTYEKAAANDEQFRKDWVEIAQICVDAGYTDCVFGSSETQTDSKKWMPSAEDIESGRWKKAWMNMVDAVRSVMPDAKFAFVPMTGGGVGESSLPDNGILEKDKWYVAEKDKAGRPYMDFWGSTLYFNTNSVNCGGDCIMTKEKIEEIDMRIRTEVADYHTHWGFMANVQYAKEKEIKLVIGELGIFDRFKEDRYYGMGDQPYAIDLLTKLMSDYKDQIELVCWFNSRSLEGKKRVWSRLDSGSSMPDAAKRLQELWGPDSPYRK